MPDTSPCQQAEHMSEVERTKQQVKLVDPSLGTLNSGCTKQEVNTNYEQGEGQQSKECRPIDFSTRWWNEVAESDPGQVAVQAESEARPLCKRQRTRIWANSQSPESDWELSNLPRKQTARRKRQAKESAQESENSFNMQEVVDELVRFAACDQELSIDLPRFSRVQSRQVCPNCSSPKISCPGQILLDHTLFKIDDFPSGLLMIPPVTAPRLLIQA